MVVDPTVREKNIIYPTDAKLGNKIIQHCWKQADRHEVKLRPRYRKEVYRCVMVSTGGEICVSQRWLIEWRASYAPRTNA